MSAEQKPRPGELSEWDDDDVEAFNDDQRGRLRGALREEHGLDADEEAALDALRPETTGETVQLADTDVRVSVKTHTNRKIEQHIQKVADEGQSDSPDLSAVRDEMIGVIVALIDGGEYSNRALWEAYADEYGITYVYDNFEAVAGPVLSRMEAMTQQQSFRQDG